jgi:opacity protein-like surface antigen
MKRLIMAMAVLAIVTSGTISVQAGGVEQNTNQSAEWVKTLNRNASLDADATFFNPAGTAMMEKGLYLYVSYQCILQPITLKSTITDATVFGMPIGSYSVNQNDFDASQDAYYFPNLYLVYNNWNMAFSLGLMAIGGGGGGKYPDGFPLVENTVGLLATAGAAGSLGVGTLLGAVGLLDPLAIGSVDAAYGDVVGTYDVDGNLEASEAFYSFQLNYAYMPIKQFAFSAGYRFIYGYNTYNGKFVIDLDGTSDTFRITEKIDATQQGMSHGVIGSLAVAPLAGMTAVGSLIIAARFEWRSDFILKTKAKKTFLAAEYADGAKSYRTLPMVLALGISYSIMGVHLDTGLTYFFNENANWDGMEKKYDNGFETGLGISYDVLKNLNIGVGYNYGTDGENDDTRSDTNIGLTWHAIGAGVTWEVIKDLKLTLGYTFAYFVPETIDGTIDYSPNASARYETKATKFTHDIAIGLQYKIL